MGYLPVGGDETLGDYDEFLRQSECTAFAAGKKCREDALKRKDCTLTEAEKKDFQNGIDRDDKELKARKCNTN